MFYTKNRKAPGKRKLSGSGEQQGQRTCKGAREEAVGQDGAAGGHPFT